MTMDELFNKVWRKDWESYVDNSMEAVFAMSHKFERSNLLLQTNGTIRTEEKDFTRKFHGKEKQEL